MSFSLGDSLHGISKPIFWKDKKNIISLSSAEFAERVVKVNFLLLTLKVLITTAADNVLVFMCGTPRN